LYKIYDNVIAHIVFFTGLAMIASGILLYFKGGIGRWFKAWRYAFKHQWEVQTKEAKKRGKIR